MIAANYTTHLYCDCDTCQERKCYFRVEGEYVAESWSATCKQARKDGWRISKDRQRCYAPGHIIKRTTKTA